MENRQFYQDAAQKGGFAFTGLLIGAIAGGVAALLFAPQSGKKTRRMLSEKASDLADMASDTADTVSKQVSQISNKAQKVQVMSIADRIRSQAMDAANKAQKKAMKAVKTTKKEDKKIMEQMASDGGGFNFSAMMLGMLIGAALGAGTALLTAPQSGERTRNMIGDKAGQLKDQAMSATENVRNQAMNVVQTAKDKAQSTIQSARQSNPNNQELRTEVDILENTRNREFPL